MSAGHIPGFATDDPGALSDPLPYLERSNQIANGVLNGRERLMPGERLLWLPAPEQAQFQDTVFFEARDHVQVLSRTWSLRRDDSGWPLLFNVFTHDDTWPEAEQSMREALSAASAAVLGSQSEPGRVVARKGVGNTTCVAPQTQLCALELFACRLKTRKAMCSSDIGND